MMLFRRI